jgi:hypothetical protein
MTKLFGLLALVSFPIIAGCAPTDREVDDDFQTIVRERASREFPCAWQHVDVHSLTGYAYQAEGCGMLQTYECEFSTGHFDDKKTIYVCKAAEPPKRAPTASPSPVTCPDGG